MDVKKAVIPVAGFGTRMLPAAKAVPKELLPVLDRPTVQHVVEEAAAGGVDDVLLVTGRDKRAVEDHFDRNAELEARLAAGGRRELLASVNDLAARVKIHSVRQAEQKGLGDAVYQAKRHVGDQPFVCMLGDTIFSTNTAAAAPEGPAGMPPANELKGRPLGRVLTKMGRLTPQQVAEALEIQKRERVLLGELFVRLGHVTPRDIELALAAQSGRWPTAVSAPAAAAPPLPVAQLVEAYRRVGTSVIGLEEVPAERVSRYGIVGGRNVGDGLFKLDTIVEKPSPESAPSRMAVAARYLLTPAVFACLEETRPGQGGEVQLTDAIQLLLRREPVHGVVLRATRHDIGNPVDWLKTNLLFASRDPATWAALRPTLASLLGGDDARG